MIYVTSELIGDTLDRAVAVAMGWKIVTWGSRQVWVQASGEGRFRSNVSDWKPSTNPAQAWPIIEGEGIDLYCSLVGQPEDKDPAWRDSSWRARYCRMGYGSEMACGKTALIAAMRAFVASKLGSEFND